MNPVISLRPVPRNSVLRSSLFTFPIIFLVVCLLPVQLYGSTTIFCDPSLNLTNRTNCDNAKPSSTYSASDNDETILIIPDIVPTDKDLGDETSSVRGSGIGITDSDGNDDNSKNSIREN